MAFTTRPDTPPHIPAELVRSFDLINDPYVLADPWAAIDRLREQGPILWSPELGGFWVISGAEEVREVFRNAEGAFSNHPTGVPPMTGFWPRKLNPQELDGDEHLRYRRLLSPFFSPKAIRPLAESVRERATELITGFADADGCEFVGQLAQPLPSWVFLDLFGAPVSEADTFTRWTADLLHSNDYATSAAAGQQIVGYLIETIAQRRRAPADDLISGLTVADVDGRPLTDEELLDMMFLLFIAGADTVSAQLGVVVHHLAVYPALQERLRLEPALVPEAMDELLRLYPIVPPARTLSRDYVMNGIQLKQGDTVLLAAMGATRDPRSFPDPTEAQIGREGNWTTAFGLGAHRCLGIHLARQELQIVLELMTELLPPYRPAPGAMWQWHTAGNIWQLDRLDLEFVRE
jgi:cytochrome P450